MSFEKIGARSLGDKKNKEHQKSWQKDVDESVGKSSKELGIYNREEVEARIKNLRETVLQMKEFEFLNELKAIASEVGVYVVGGSVRDAVLQKPAKDIDLVVNRIDPVVLVDVLLKYGRVTFDRKPEAELDKMTQEEKTQLIKNSYGVIKFKPENSTLPEPIDISFPREDDYSLSGQSGISGIKRDTDAKADPSLDIIKDLERRDLTINAMAVGLTRSEIVDPFAGIESIVKGEIRTVGNPKDRILKEDLSRALRVIRFACLFSSNVENRTKKVMQEIFKPSNQSAEEIYVDHPEILAQVKQCEKEVRELFNVPSGSLPKCLQVFWDREQKKPRMAVAKEVMSKEILKSFKANPQKFIELMDEVGGLKVILPEVAAMKSVDQNREHHREGNVFAHTMLLFQNLPKDASLRLKLSALFHDLGKVDTQKIDEKGKITFQGHEEKSLLHIQKIAKRFRLPAKLTEEVVWLVQKHMWQFSFDDKKVKATTIDKMFLEKADLGEDLIALFRADALASFPEEGSPNTEQIDLLVERIAQVKKSKETNASEKQFAPIVTGKDLIGLGLKPGVYFSQILEEIKNAQLEGEIKTKEEGLVLVEQLVGKLKDKSN